MKTHKCKVKYRMHNKMLDFQLIKTKKLFNNFNNTKRLLNKTINKVLN